MLAVKNLLNNRVRTILITTAVTLAVLSVILLASLGSGLVATGEQAFQKSTMHLWITGRPVDLQTKYANMGQANLDNVHELAADISTDPRITVSTPVLTEMIYAYKDNTRPKAVFGLGVATGGSLVVIQEGSPLNQSRHYNNGAYDGAWTNEVLVDSRSAALLDVGIGDIIHAGKTLNDAGDHEFMVVGITNSLSAFSMNPMVVFPFPEFQDLTGNHYYDSASMIIIRLQKPEDAGPVQADLAAKYPDYVVSTNRDFLAKIIRDNSFILASAFSMVLVAVLMGGALVINTMLLSINEKRKEIGIMQVMGLSRWSIIKSLGLEGLVVTVLGGALGCFLSIPVTMGLNSAIASTPGFGDVLVLDDRFLIWGFIMAMTLGLLTVAIAVWRLGKIKPIDQLRCL